MIRLASVRTALAALLLGSALALPLTQSVAPQGAHAAGGPTFAENRLLGFWHNTDPNTRDITLLHVYYDAQYHADRVEVWGKCHPTDCFWGTETVSFDTPTVGSAYFWSNLGLTRNIVAMERLSGFRLDVLHQESRTFTADPDLFVRSIFAQGA